MSATTMVRERNRPKVVEHYVDLNSASRKELMTLPGIGAAEARRIIAHRPYLTKTELVTKGVLQTGPFLTLRHQVVAMQKFKQNPKNGAQLAAARTEGSPANGSKSP
jgi:predicted DNA-binding helix-hairpin-helix protein